jgi:hypothetical protein
MHISRGTLIGFMAFAPLMMHGQAGPSTGATTSTAGTTPAVPVAPSSVLQPALGTVESTLNSLKIDKWKKGTVREEAGHNVNDILKDLKTNLPPLVADADAAPGALSKSIPLMKHLDALYDVLLRVEEGARVSAPGDQIDQLEAALKQFGGARLTLYDSMTQGAAGQEKQITDLQAAIKAQKAPAEEHKAAPAAVPCTPPAKPPAKKKRVTPKATPPAPGQPAPGQPAQTPPGQPKP